MLLLGPDKQRVQWPEAGMFFDLIPLDQETDQQFIKDTTVVERDEKTKEVKHVYRDTVAYAKKVGNHCIKGWGGAVGKDDKGELQPLDCTQANIDQLMIVDVAQDFIYSKVKGLALYLVEERDAAKNE